LATTISSRLVSRRRRRATAIDRASERDGTRSGRQAKIGDRQVRDAGVDELLHQRSLTARAPHRPPRDARRDEVVQQHPFGAGELRAGHDREQPLRRAGGRFPRGASEAGAPPELVEVQPGCAPSRASSIAIRAGIGIGIGIAAERGDEVGRRPHARGERTVLARVPVVKRIEPARVSALAPGAPGRGLARVHDLDVGVDDDAVSLLAKARAQLEILGVEEPALAVRRPATQRARAEHVHRVAHPLDLDEPGGDARGRRREQCRP
jgi:hypothetical protein